MVNIFNTAFSVFIFLSHYAKSIANVLVIGFPGVILETTTGPPSA